MVMPTKATTEEPSLSRIVSSVMEISVRSKNSWCLLNLWTSGRDCIVEVLIVFGSWWGE